MFWIAGGLSEPHTRLMLWLIGPVGWLGQLGAFVAFRFFDAAKPGPVAWT